MDFSIKGCDWNQAVSKNTLDSVLNGAAKPGCIVVGVFEGKSLAGAARHIDVATQGMLTRLIKGGHFNGKSDMTLMLHEAPGVGACRVLLVGLGKEEAFNDKAYLKATQNGWRALADAPATHVVWTLTHLASEHYDAAWAVRSAIVALRQRAYRFMQLKSKPDAPAYHVKKIILMVDALHEKSAKLALKQGVALANGIDLTRDLGNFPGNLCTPVYLADTAKQLARDWSLKVEVLGQKQLEALKMGSFLSVAKGSVQPPQFIVLHYRGGPAKQAPVVLVGKGITFDSGGISLKPGEGMDEMKFDMCGAASVLGTLRAVAEIGLKCNIVGVIPTCENMPNGNANKPGDIVTSMSGQTIEILNTDAEGRLILCDALTYVARFKPEAVIDIATLTGACVVALGHHNSALYTKDDALAHALLMAAKTAHDPTWRMPLDEEYHEQFKSNFADMANTGGRVAGSITAACFLSRFTEAYAWAHLDIAGTAWKRGAAKGATGRPVALLVQFLLDRAG
jgi:leucyl aminopeptidase